MAAHQIHWIRIFCDPHDNNHLYDIEFRSTSETRSLAIEIWYWRVYRKDFRLLWSLDKHWGVLECIQILSLQEILWCFLRALLADYWQARQMDFQSDQNARGKVWNVQVKEDGCNLPQVWSHYCKFVAPLLLSLRLYWLDLETLSGYSTASNHFHN